MTYYVEVRKTLKRTSSPHLVPLSDAYKYTGFRSVYAYPEEMAETIKATRRTSEMRDQSVYSDTLFMDFDDVDPVEFRAWLKAQEVQYEEWDSGNRSVHFHIPIEPMFGAHVPYSQKLWVKEHAPLADVSFYHPAGQYRLPNTFHRKNPGHCKQLVYKNNGRLLHIPDRKQEFTNYMLNAEDDSSKNQFFSMLLVSKSEGFRQPYIWQAATVAAEAGVDLQSAIELINWWNASLAHPSHPEDIVNKQIERAYQRAMRRV